MKLDAMSAGGKLADAQRYAQAIEAAGLDAVWVTESGRTPYMQCAAIALATERITIGTAVAVAFPRSPFITAATAWELAESSGGRFVLGLGTQVKAHIERRYGVEFSPPGPRMADYITAVRAVWDSFQTKAPLRHDGPYYQHTIGNLGIWTGGPIDHPDIPIYLAGVRPWMLRMIGELADGIHVHPFHSRRYIDEVIRPNIAEGLARSGRADTAVSYAVPVMTIVGDTVEERQRLREFARYQVAFYGSTRTYSGVFDLHGWVGTSDKLHELQRKGDMAGMAATINDEMLAAYSIESSWDELADRLIERYQGVADRLVMYSLANSWRANPGVLERWAAVADELHRKTV